MAFHNYLLSLFNRLENTEVSYFYVITIQTKHFIERFQNYLFTSVFNKIDDQDQAQKETNTAVKERWKRAYALLQPS